MHRLTDQSIATLGPTDGAVLAVAVSLDGNRFVSANDQTIYVWDRPSDPKEISVARGKRDSGEVAKSWIDHQLPWVIDRLEVEPRAVTFDRQVKQVATVDGSTIKIWNLTTRQVTQTMSQSSHKPKVIGFTNDGKRLVTADDKQAIVWSVETGDITQVLAGHDMSVNCLSVSVDGRYVLVGGSTVVQGATRSQRGAVVVWNTSTRQLILRHTSIEEPVESLAINPNGQLLACGTRRRVVLLDRPSGESNDTLDTAGYALAFGPDDQRLAISDQNAVITIWDFAKTQPLKTLSGHQRLVKSLAFSHDGHRLISGGWDASVKIWDTDLDTYSFQYDTNQTPILSPDGRYLFVDQHSDEKAVAQA